MMHPYTWPLGEYVWLKTRFVSYLYPHDVMSLHWQIYKEHPEIIDDYREAGYCLSIYGGSKEVMQSWLGKVDMAVVDHPEDIHYDDAATEKLVKTPYQPRTSPY